MTKETWKELSPKQQWDIQVALRGPDCQDSECMKWFTTAVIRGQMSPIQRVGGTVNEDLKLVIVPQEWGSSQVIYPPTTTREVREVIRAHLLRIGTWNSHHFFEHIITAATHMGLPVGYVDTQVWQTVIMTHPKVAGKAFIESLTNLAEVNEAAEMERHYKSMLKGAGGY